MTELQKNKTKKKIVFMEKALVTINVKSSLYAGDLLLDNIPWLDRSAEVDSDQIKTLFGWLFGILWHINPCGLFNARYTICK